MAKPVPPPQPGSVDDDAWLGRQSREVLLGLVKELRELIRRKDRQVAELKHQLTQAQRWRFGRRSEKVKGKSNAEEKDSNAAVTKPAQRKARPHGRRKPPKDLPVERIEHPITESDLVCPSCHKPRTRIGEDVSSQLDFVPGYFRTLEHVQPRYACPDCRDVVVTAPRPPEAVPRCLASPRLLAQVVTSKLADHLPLNRQVAIYRRYGLEVTRSTLCGWVIGFADAMVPLYIVLKRDVLCSDLLGADDTGLRFLERGRDRARHGHLWCYYGDARHPRIFFEFTPDWKNEWPLATLEGWTGILQADAYKGWDAVFRAEPQRREAGCWAHSRRKWFEAVDTSPSLALAAVSFIRALYDVEDEAKDMPAEGRQHLRAARARPQLDSFRAWLDERAQSVLPKSPISRAFSYTIRQWDALGRYIENGEIPIDNNRVERTLRPVAVGRANWLFAGSQDGGQRAAILLSFVASCRRIGIDPLKYFTDVLERLASHPRDDLASLLPGNWKPRSDLSATATRTTAARTVG